MHSSDRTMVATRALICAAATQAGPDGGGPGTPDFAKAVLAIGAFADALPEGAAKAELQRLLAAVPTPDVFLTAPVEEEEDATLMLLREAISLGRRDGMAGQHLSAMCSARDRLEGYDRRAMGLAELLPVRADIEGVTQFVVTVEMVRDPVARPGGPVMHRQVMAQRVPPGLGDLARLLMAFAAAGEAEDAG